jgi:hypothetical protein
MTPGQLVAVMTIGAAAMVALQGVLLAAAIAVSQRIYEAVATLIGAKQLTAAWLAAAVAVIAVAAAVGLCALREVLAGWLMKRELSRLRSSYKDVEMALGTDAANRYLEWKASEVGRDLEARKIKLSPPYLPSRDSLK